jgi:hypothetical protein
LAIIALACAASWHAAEAQQAPPPAVLVIASGAGAATQRAVGTAVFGGMIAASFLGIFVIPGLYVSFQWAREKIKGTGKSGAPAAAADD